MKTISTLRIVAAAALATSAAALLAGCYRGPHEHHLRWQRPLLVADRLDCPENQGQLTRVSASADGNTCDYRRDDGEQIELTRMALNGQSPQTALAPIETVLKTLVPARHDNGSESGGGASASTDNDHDHDDAHIDVPGVHIDAHGDKAQVKILGMTIDADNDKANVHAGFGSNKAVVVADDNGAEVRATDINRSNANLVLVLASEKPGPTGFRTVGYIARGPVGGPLVVARFQSKEHHAGMSDDHDLHRLMDRSLTH